MIGEQVSRRKVAEPLRRGANNDGNEEMSVFNRNRYSGQLFGTAQASRHIQDTPRMGIR